jgi:hypothetical protein
MENNKYKEINFEVFSGISKSLLKSLANIPRKKKSKAGLVRFSTRRFRFMW